MNSAGMQGSPIISLHTFQCSAGRVITGICGKNAAFCNLLWGLERGTEHPATPRSSLTARTVHTVRAHLSMQENRGGAGAERKQSLERFHLSSAG